MVLLFHFTVRYPQKYPSFSYASPSLVSLSFGWIGVHLFFMISGFIIYMTIQKKQGPIHFLTARLARLVPPYWAAIALILGLSSLYRSAMQVELAATAPAILANLAMVPDVLHYSALDGAFWSLYVELKFYILFAVLWNFVNLRSQRVFLCSYAVIVLLTVMHNHVRHLPYGQDLSYFPIFWTGIAAYKVLHEGLNVWVYAGIAAITTASTYGYHRHGLELLVGIPVFALMFAVVEKIFATNKRLESLFAPLSRLGRVSYSYYLVHQPVGYLVLGLLSVLAINVHLALLAAIAACLMVAVLGFTFIEQLDKPIGKTVFTAYLRFADKAGLSLR